MSDLTTQLAILSYSIGEGTCSVDGRLVAAAARRIEELEAEVERLRNQLAYEISEANKTAEELRQSKQRAVDESARLRAALEPFAAIGRSLADNWPGECRLREDSEFRAPPDHHRGVQGWHHWLAYWGCNDGGMLPTLAEWRAAAEAAGGGPGRRSFTPPSSARKPDSAVNSAGREW